ncbi:hypothetical protein KA001_02215 [Patescibacteria group bacterium]|nr:hypothetical protein [Patescibacteria group bacterium]
MDYKKIFFTTSLIGTLYSYSAVILDYINFYKIAGTVFTLKYGLLPNPVVTPCFWGAFAFLLCAIITYKFLKADKTDLTKFKYFILFVVASCTFALSNLSLEFKKFFEAGGKQYIGCSGQTVSNPFLTPCFGGSFIFVILLLVTSYSFRKIKKINV